MVVPELNMKGAYLYDSNTINAKVWKQKIGNYALGHSKEGIFYPKYVGRSDTDLHAELISHLQDKSNHKEFMFSYASSISEAFREECRNYHDFFYNKEGGKQLENEIHPATPEGTSLKCTLPHKS